MPSDVSIYQALIHPHLQKATPELKLWVRNAKSHILRSIQEAKKKKIQHNQPITDCIEVSFPSEDYPNTILDLSVPNYLNFLR